MIIIVIAIILFLIMLTLIMADLFAWREFHANVDRVLQNSIDKLKAWLWLPIVDWFSSDDDEDIDNETQIN